MVFLQAEWRNLLMANYAVHSSILQPYLPIGTELDEFNGTHYASMVGFLFANTRVRGISIPGHRNFEEVNLRFYVRYKDNGVWKRGVVFLKEIVPKRMIAWVANTLYGENYVCYPMRHQWTRLASRLNVSYDWKVGADWNSMKASASLEGQEPVAGSEEEFITGHYWGYTKIDDRSTGSYQVAHPSWRVHPVHEYELQCDVARLYGPAFADALIQNPRSVFLADGSAVEVMKGQRIGSPTKALTS